MKEQSKQLLEKKDSIKLIKVREVHIIYCCPKCVYFWPDPGSYVYMGKHRVSCRRRCPRRNVERNIATYTNPRPRFPLPLKTLRIMRQRLSAPHVICALPPVAAICVSTMFASLVWRVWFMCALVYLLSVWSGLRESSALCGADMVVRQRTEDELEAAFNTEESPLLLPLLASTTKPLQPFS